MAGRGLIGLANGMDQLPGDDTTGPGFRYPPSQADADGSGLSDWLAATRQLYGISHEAGETAVPVYTDHRQDPQLLLMADAGSPAPGTGRTASGPGVGNPVPDDPQGAHDWFIHNEHDGRNDAANLRDPVYQNWLQAQDHLVDAATHAGVDPGTLARIAYVESRFSPTVRPSGSSALGYGQMTDRAWIQAVRDFGAQYGIPNARRLSDSQALAYRRTDPEFQAEMFARSTQKNIEAIRGLGGADDQANLYAVHVLGPSGGSKFLRALAANPDAPIAATYSQTGPHDVSLGAVRNNPSLLGGGITLRQAYQNMGAVVRSDQARRYAELAQARQKERN